MFLRDAPTKTLSDVREELEGSTTESIQAPNSDVKVDLTDANTIRFESSNIEVPANAASVKALGDWLDVPSKFLQRLDGDVQQHLLTTLLERNPGTGAFYLHRENGLQQVRKPSEKVIEPIRLVNSAIKVIDPAANVVDTWRADEFRLDVIAPEGFDRGIGGDPKVGDITRGGIRIAHDTKHNLAPSVSEFAYRLVCTNGMEFFDEGLKVDARASTVEDVLSAFEEMADRAFRRVEQSIASFYQLRQEQVDNPERTLIRLAEERGLPSRTTMALAERVPALVEDGEPTMFDLVNLITNQANDPRIRNRTGARRTLEQAGGSVITEHAERCGHCRSKLN